jgi:hypothetical protein
MKKVVTALLADYDPAVRKIALKARTLILDVIPDAIEMVDVKAHLLAYGYAATYKGLICGLALQKSYVNLMFAKGTQLPDPKGLLEGTGKLARHVKLKTPDDVGKSGVRDLLKAAVEIMKPARS